MFFFKSCPRCSGDRVLEQDRYGSYLTCVACGHVTYLDAARPQKPSKVLATRPVEAGSR
jgi:uncharacterized Zn finger protein